MIIRPKYMEFIRPYFNTPFVKILTGIRRCGKSTLLEMIMNELLENGVKKENVIYLRLDSFINDDITTGKELYNFISSSIKNEKVYIQFNKLWYNGFNAAWQSARRLLASTAGRGYVLKLCEVCKRR